MLPHWNCDAALCHGPIVDSWRRQHPGSLAECVRRNPTSVSEMEPDGNPVQGNYYEVAGLRNKVVGSGTGHDGGGWGTTVDARRAEMVE